MEVMVKVCVIVLHLLPQYWQNCFFKHHAFNSLAANGVDFDPIRNNLKLIIILVYI